MNLKPRTVADYTALITSEHALRPKFVATVELACALQAQLQSVLASLPKEFDVYEAIGAQLDSVGLWVGASRYLRIPLTGVYFTWDDMVQTGWGAGTWKGPFDPDSGLTRLPDDSYRVLILGKIAANHWDGSIPGVYSVWDQVFPASDIVIQDNQDMSMVVGIANAQLSTVDLALLTGGYIPLKPEGVRVSYYAVSDEGPLFAWDADSVALKGWDYGYWPTLIEPT